MGVEPKKCSPRVAVEEEETEEVKHIIVEKDASPSVEVKRLHL